MGFEAVSFLESLLPTKAGYCLPDAADRKNDGACPPKARAHKPGLPPAPDTTPANRCDLGPAGGRCATEPAPWPADAADAADFVLLLDEHDLPEEPFEFASQQRVIVDRAKFLTRLQADAWLGLGGPRARYGVIQRDLRRLHQLLVGTNGET